MENERQTANAIKFYESKSHTYDSTWHPSFCTRFLSHLPIHPGQNILDLACGTGLLTFLLADAVGPSGHVTGIDITPGMISIARAKKSGAGTQYDHVDLVEADIQDLGSVSELMGERFDVITVASALVLFPDPKKAVEHWARWLVPGGVLAVDATHPRNLVSGMVLELTARRLHLPLPYNRAWSQSEQTLRRLLETSGLEVEKVVTIEDQAGYGRRFHAVESWDDHFVENVIMKDVVKTFANNEVRREAQGVFKEEWEGLSEGGRVEEVDAVFLGVARRPADGSRFVPRDPDADVVFKGGCRCGSVQYLSTARPSEITLCHCRACQQVSGSGYLPFFEVPASSLTFTAEATRRKLQLSDVAERTFCSRCGSPISMVYSFNPESTGLTLGSVDVASFKGEFPGARKHIYLKEKAPWTVLPEDGVERADTSTVAHLITPYEKAKTG